MDTKILYNNSKDLKIAADILKKGGVVAIPTETVYGLAVDALNPVAVEKIYRIKSRETKKALPVLIPNMSFMSRVAREVNSTATKLAKAFWPGPLTMILKKQTAVPDITTAGNDTIAVRFTSNLTIRRLMQKSNLVLTATSANISGEPNLITATEVKNKLFGAVDAILCEDIDEPQDKVSTLVDVTGNKLCVLREGIISKTAILKASNKNYPLIIGVTGPTGSGKSTAIKNIADDKGYCIIDADKIAKQIVEKNKPCLEKLTDEFGETILNQDFSLNRKALANFAFSSEESTNKLNAITHPYIIDTIRNNINKIDDRDKNVVIIDAPTLIQSGADALCDKIIAVTANEDDRLDRIVNRDSLNSKEAKLRIGAGLYIEQYKDNADFFIDTSNYTEKDTIAKMEQILELYIDNEL